MPSDEYLGPYKIGELIGRGGMGNVYSAEHAKTGERVAVKLIAAHVSDDPRFRRRFDREILALKMLRHPGIVRIIGEGEDEQGRLFYSMELITGETVQDRVRRLKKLPWQSVIDISIEICAALKHAHDIGVTHRDLKPANLILTEDDSVKIVDFGIPKVFGDSGEQTQVGSVLGTPDYMAPEQATGGPITPRTDLYSLGSVMYAMLLGRAPFKGKNSTEVIDALRRDQPVPLDLVDTDLPADLVALVHHLLEKDPDRRPPTALAVMNRLKAMRNGLLQQATIGIDSSSTDGVGDSSGMAETSITNPVTDAPLLNTRVAGTEEVGKKLPDDATLPMGTVKTVRGSRRGTEVYNPTSAPESDREQPRARFSTVGEGKLAGRFSESEKASSSSLMQALAIAGMVLVLICGGYLFYRASQPPTADALYETIIERGDLATMGTFLRRFPDDDRFAEVHDMELEQRLSATLRRLGAQAKIGISPLEPAEDGFVAAMEKRQTDPAETAERLQKWMDAFAKPDDQSDDKLQTLMELARREQSVVKRRSPKTVVDPRAVKLLAEVDAASETLDAVAARTKLIGIIETFADKDWAEPAVAEARQRLENFPEP